MSFFDDETRLTVIDPSLQDGAASFTGTLSAAYNIGSHPNGGYLLALAGQALRLTTPDQPDPLSITAHYLRPGLPDQPFRIDTQRLRSGRTLSTLRATFAQEGGARLELLAAMGVLDTGGDPALTLPPPDLPPPYECVGRSGAAQGVFLPLLERIEVRLHPDEAVPGRTGEARISGWIRFVDGREPDALACLLMADAFPPAVFGLLGAVGWVPTIELTVHLRRKPVAGWLRGEFRAHDLSGGRLIEDGALWDADGHLIAQSRQLALVRQA